MSIALFYSYLICGDNSITLSNNHLNSDCMKTIRIIIIGLLMTTALMAQNSYQQEVVCPGLLEFSFPKSLGDGESLLQSFGGVPVLRLKKAVIKGNKLVCQYEMAFAKFHFDGFGFVEQGSHLDEVPYEIVLTLVEDHLHGWIPSRKTVKLSHYHRGCVVYTIDRCSDEGVYSWHGAFYKSKYQGKRITLYRTFDNEARINNTGDGFILSDTKTGLYSPAVNTKAVSKPVVKGKNKKVLKRKK